MYLSHVLEGDTPCFRNTLWLAAVERLEEGFAAHRSVLIGRASARVIVLPPPMAGAHGVPVTVTAEL